VLRIALDIIHKKCVDDASKMLGIKDSLLIPIICDMMIDMSLAMIFSALLGSSKNTMEREDFEEMSNYWGE